MKYSRPNLYAEYTITVSSVMSEVKLVISNFCFTYKLKSCNRPARLPQYTNVYSLPLEFVTYLCIVQLYKTNKLKLIAKTPMKKSGNW